MNSNQLKGKKHFACLVFLLTAVLSGCKDEIARVGESAPSVAAFDARQQEIKLADYQGKPVVLEFWSETCGACLLMMKKWQQVVQERPDDLTVISINIDDKEVDLDAIADDLGISFLLGKDQLGITQERYLVSVTPTTFFINKAGVIEKTHIGYSSGMDLNGYINKLQTK
ncbi:TlpA family protein disulfide reductase [Vibrio albus]|uniref:TlpA family protein disulfide reductase n=1 Tax=Vibrio albus TaxID=2200953 RepID=A0A2U3B8Z0_9VIBR|nr:TlpA disulfide reductase family protein [Vibrio albus]PWI33276.1 TlpA family protein disulfide reductase [Vibrio albus]